MVKRNVSSSQTSSTVHDATMDCANHDLRSKALQHCLKDLRQVAWRGYPWSALDRQEIPRNGQNVTDNLRDALDSLNHVCYIHHRSQRCLRKHGIRDFCLASSGGYKEAVDFEFICHRRQRDENLIRSLQCLRDKRLLVMLNFHIASRCRGFGILDDLVTQENNADFYTMNVNPNTDLPPIPLLYCLPKHVITTCIRPLIDDECGVMTADLVQQHLLYSQHWFGQALRSAGLYSDICEYDIGSNYTLDTSSIPSLHGKFGFIRLLEMSAPGTALDTLYGKAIMDYLRSLSGEELCTTVPASVASEACVLSSGGKSDIAKFNSLQFAHTIIPVAYYMLPTHCSRLEQFAASWNLLQEICGPKVRGLEQHATLLVEGCKIQSEMDTAGCHWQDMLLPHYIRASQVTTWPRTAQCLVNQMSLETTLYKASVVSKDLDKVISLLQPGVEDISRICGRHHAVRVQVLLRKILYLQHDAFEYGSLLDHSFIYT